VARHLDAPARDRAPSMRSCPSERPNWEPDGRKAPVRFCEGGVLLLQRRSRPLLTQTALPSGRQKYGMIRGAMPSLAVDPGSCGGHRPTGSRDCGAARRGACASLAGTLGPWSDPSGGPPSHRTIWNLQRATPTGIGRGRPTMRGSRMPRNVRRLPTGPSKLGPRGLDVASPEDSRPALHRSPSRSKRLR